MRRKKNSTLKTVLMYVGIATAGAVFRKQIIEWVGKIPVLGDFVKDMSTKQESKQ